jgi:hypothetical protein
VALGSKAVRASFKALAHLASHGTPPDRETAKKISVGLEGSLEKFNSEVIPYLSIGGTEIQFVYGANGRGKTHYLLSLEESARNQGFVTARIDCSIGGTPFQSLDATYRMIANALRPPPSMAVDQSVGVTSIIRSAFGDEAELPAEQVLRKLKIAKHLCPEVRNLALSYGQGCMSGQLTDHLAGQIEYLLLGAQGRLITISSLYKLDRSLPRPLGKLTSRNSANWLRSLLSLPHALGYPGLILLFDETERVMHSLSPSARQAQLAHIRNIVDYCALGAFNGCLILYAAADDFVDSARRDLDALAQRIEPPSLLKGNWPSSMRSVWTDLDDLTEPSTQDPTFFELLSDRIVGLGIDAGLSTARAGDLKRTLKGSAIRFANSPTSSVVREFVKKAASAVLMEVPRRG